MKLLITGACGFVGNSIARHLREHHPNFQITGLDNLSREGSESNRVELGRRGIPLVHADVRCASDFETLPAVDWVIDAAANPSVLAGIQGSASSRQTIEHNLGGTINLLEYCRRSKAGIVLLSTSRVYSIRGLAALPLELDQQRFRLKKDAELPGGVSNRGIAENFSVEPPMSLYGATKLSSELLAVEYAESFGTSVWINRCGILAGAGQFGRPDQGIIAYWINAYLRKQPLRFVGFGGGGPQVRDAFHPRDLAELIARQIASAAPPSAPRVVNLGGGTPNTFSLAELTTWCRDRFGFAHPVAAEPETRALDVPWLVMDHALATDNWKWSPRTSLNKILDEVAAHAEQHSDWLETSGATAR